MTKGLLRVIVSSSVVALVNIAAALCQSVTALAAQNDDDSPLELARKLEPPPETLTEKGETENSDYWEEHSDLLRAAWKEWKLSSHENLMVDWQKTLVDPVLERSIRNAWEDPRRQKEDQVRHLWTEVIPETAYSASFFDPHKVETLRQALQAPSEAGIPLRRPNGMNRHGIIVDPETDGAVHQPDLVAFYHELVDEYVRPMGRLFFPEYFGRKQDVDSASYAFTIRYKQGQDVLLKEHSDASVVTLNINLGSNKTDTTSPDIYIQDENGDYHNVTFAPGMAVLHRGMLRHGAYRISRDDERMNLVIWLFGPGGYVRVAPFPPDQQLTPTERWRKESGLAKSDFSEL